MHGAPLLSLLFNLLCAILASFLSYYKQKHVIITLRFRICCCSVDHLSLSRFRSSKCGMLDFRFLAVLIFFFIAANAVSNFQSCNLQLQLSLLNLLIVHVVNSICSLLLF